MSISELDPTIESVASLEEDFKAPSAPDPRHAAHHARRWWILAMLGVAQLMVVLDGTVVNIALPSAQKALDFSNGDRQWIVTGYALAFGSLLLIGGRLADLVGRKTTFLIGLFGFAIASAIGGAAQNFGMLVASRAVQGAFAALLAPAVLSLLTTTFTDPKERGRAFGVFGAIAGGGAAVGLLLGGFLTEYLSWRWCMYVNIIFAVIAIIGALVLLSRQIGQDRPKLDIPGVLTVSAGLFALVYGFSNANDNGKVNWGSPWTIGYLMAAFVLLVAFVIIQTRSKSPLLPMRVLLDRNRGGAFLSMLLSAAGMFGVFLFLTYYMQQNLGYTAMQCGIAFLPMVGVLMVASVVSSAVLSGRVSPRIMIPLGLALGGVAMILLTRVSVNSDYAGDLLPSLLLFGAGLGLIFSTSMSVATLGVRREDAGVASATVNTVQQVGGAVGTALLNTLAIQAATAYGNTNKPSTGQLGQLAQAKNVLAHAQDLMQHAATQGPAAIEKTKALIAGATSGLQHAASAGRSIIAHAQVASYSTAFWWSAAFFLTGAVVTVIALRSGVPAELKGTDTESDAAPVMTH